MEVVAALAAAFAELIALLVQAVFSLLQLIAEALGLSIGILAKKPAEGESHFSGKRLLLAVMPLVIMILLIGAIFWIAQWRAQVERRRFEATRKQVNMEVERLVQQKAPNGRLQRNPNAQLDARDAWGRPFQVAYEEGVLRESVTVRSTGPDSKPDTLDDISATRTIMLPKQEVGRMVVDKVAGKLRDVIADGQNDQQQ